MGARTNAEAMSGRSLEGNDMEMKQAAATDLVSIFGSFGRLLIGVFDLLIEVSGCAEESYVFHHSRRGICFYVV